MNKPYYCEYARHIARFYARNTSRKLFASEADRRNWAACDRAIGNYEGENKEIIIFVYGEFGALADNVRKASERFEVKRSFIWSLIKSFEKEVSRQRGLL